MIGIGWFELCIVAVVLLVVVGPERMPEIVRFMSRVMREVRAAAGEIRHQVEEVAALDEVREHTQAIRESLKDADIREDLRLIAKDTDADLAALSETLSAPAAPSHPPKAAAEPSPAPETPVEEAAPKE